MNDRKRMNITKSYIAVGGWPRLSTGRDRGAAGREGSLETREGRGRPSHLLKNALTAMLPSVPRKDQRIVVGLHTNGVIHLRVQSLDHIAVIAQIRLSGAVVLGK